MKELTKILIIDDDALFVFLTRKSMETTGYPTEITELRDGLEGLDYLKQLNSQEELLPDVIFLDLNMPVMDGWDFIEEFKDIKKLWLKDVSLYIFSSSISPYDIERAKELSIVTDFIIKPLTKEKLQNILESL